MKTRPGWKCLLLAAILFAGPAADGWADEEQASFGPRTLAPGESLAVGRIGLSFQADGRLVLCRDPGTAKQATLWTSGPGGRRGGLSAVFAGKGGLALQEDGVAYWQAGTKGADGDQLVLSTRPPYLTIRAAGGELRWVTQTPLCFLGPNTFFFDKAGKPADAAGKPELKSLFADPKSWEKARGHVNVFKVYSQTVDANTVPELATVFAFLRANGIALAMEAGVVNGGKAGCGQGIEGYGGEQVGDRAAKIKQAGGDLAYIAIDESFAGGHYHPEGCHLDPETLALNVLQTYAAAKASFPGVEFGDIENLPGEVSAGSRDYLENFVVWYRTLNAGMDVPLAFFHLDADWTKPSWDGSIAAMREVLREGGTSFGIIVNGDNDARSAAEWTRSNHRIVQTIKASRAGPFEHLVFQSWNPFPAVLVPEEEPESLTGGVNFYFEGESQPAGQ